MRPVRSWRRALGVPGLAGLVLLGTAAWLGQAPAPAPVVQAVVRPAPPSPVGPRVAALLDQAGRLGVQIGATEQQERGGEGGGLRLATPARADYLALRRFVEASLAADPRLALESLRLHRDQPAAPLLDAELVWWLDGGGR